MPNLAMTQTFYIRDQRSLSGLVDRLDGAAEIALDTEFLRERTYYPKLCLLQLATADVQALVDPLAVEDLTALWRLLTSGPEITLHAATQDLEIVLRHAGSLPQRHFDSQVAAAFLGYGDSIGYAKLVERLLGTSLRRSEAYTDWTVRPLTSEQQGYALDDVTYLRECVRILRDELETRGRAAWVREELQEQAKSIDHTPDPEQQWRRVSGARGLRGRNLAVMREVAAWRERQATSRDVPRQRIVPDRVLVEIARRKPTTREGIESLRGLHPREVQRSADELLDRVRHAMELPESDWPSWPTPPPNATDPRVDEIAAYLDAWIRARGRDLDLSSRLLATRQELENVVRYELGGQLDENAAGIPLLSGWRRKIAGDQVIRLLRGEAGLRVRSGAAGPDLVVV